MLALLLHFKLKQLSEPGAEPWDLPVEASVVVSADGGGSKGAPVGHDLRLATNAGDPTTTLVIAKRRP